MAWPSKLIGSEAAAHWLNRLVEMCQRSAIVESPDIRLAPCSAGTQLFIRKGAGGGGESGTLQFRGEWDSVAAYSRGDIVIRGSNNARGPGLLDATGILQNGHKAGTYIALVDIPALQAGNLAPGEPDTSQQWETFARGAWHFLSVKPTDPSKTHGIELDGRGDYVALIINGSSGKSVVIDVDHPLRALRDNARWVEIDVCENGVAKKMQVLGTLPYIP